MMKRCLFRFCAAPSSANGVATTASLIKALAGATSLVRNNRTSTVGPFLPLETALSQHTTSTITPDTADAATAAATTTTTAAQPVKYVLLYFSAAWCPPCRQFTPILSKFYQQHSKNKEFEVVFCSWDQNDSEFANYFKTHPEWLAVDRSLVDNLAVQYNIQTIPSLMVVDAATGEIVTRKGRLGVANDPSGKDFPWKGIDFSPHVNVNAPKNALLIGGSATVAASLLLWSFSQQNDGGFNGNGRVVKQQTTIGVATPAV